MPFKSKAQLRTCYSSRRWDCDKWLEHTPSICCLPEKKGLPVKSRCIKDNEKVKGPIITGPRGGKFFVITEKNKKGEMCQMKVYVK